MTSYPFSCRFSVRWRDLDPLGHVNNSVVVTFLEVARVRMWGQQFPATTPDEVPFVVASLSLDFRSPILLQDEVEVSIALEALGRSSFTFRYRIEASGRLAAEARTVMVYLDGESKRPTAMPEAFRSQLIGFLGEPERQPVASSSS